ncbi:hypothetical protein JOQ06_013715 [Pogonophryne albipinna]|uniref:DUF4371 domain-containing protein n=1 Tax=Pogonophryne albipinna TaxID=1090488 RepID=A0AAD6BK86_9TELE|nr:hypothetical protein JOQ06_013715 [Pogonophryne albipinna]
MVIVLRYIMPDLTVTERFLEFVEVKDKTGVGLSNSIKAVLEPLKLKDKLIAQTYDGAAVMSGNVRGVQTVMKETYPNAQFVHCYAHQLNLTLQQLCSARLSILKENVQKMRQQTDALAATAHDGTDEPGRRVSSTAPVMKEACDTVISQALQLAAAVGARTDVMEEEPNQNNEPKESEQNQNQSREEKRGKSVAEQND